MGTAAEVFDELAFEPEMVEVVSVAYAKVHKALNNPDLSADANEAITLQIQILSLAQARRAGYRPFMWSDARDTRQADYARKVATQISHARVDTIEVAKTKTHS